MHTQGRPSFAKPPLVALQEMVSLAYAWWRLQWLRPYLYSQLKLPLNVYVDHCKAVRVDRLKGERADVSRAGYLLKS